MFWCVSFCFGGFGSVSHSMKLRAKRAKLLQLMQKFVPRRLVRNFCHDVILEIFATNTPNPHYWTLNSCFGAFFFVRVHFEIVSLLHETWCKTRQTGTINAKVRVMMSCKNFLQ